MIFHLERRESAAADLASWDVLVEMKQMFPAVYAVKYMETN